MSIERTPISRALIAAAACLVAATAMLGCTTATSSVELIVRSTFGTGVNGVDRYRLRVSRRDGTHRWRPAYECIFYLPQSAVVAAGSTDSGPDCGMVSEGRHVLRNGAGASPDDPMLVEVQGGLTRDDTVFVPRGLPAIAQFTLPVGRGRLALSLEESCLTVDPRARGTLSPYYTCVVDQQGANRCPTLASICVTFGNDGTALRTECIENPSQITAPGDAGIDAGVRDRGVACAVDPSRLADPATRPPGDRVEPGGAVRFSDCARFETCGVNGAWSRCLETSTCENRGLGESCCVAPPIDRACPQLIAVAPCSENAYCNAATGSASQCTTCPGTGCCTEDRSCGSGFVCVTGACVCGQRAGDPCCAAGVCGAALACIGNSAGETGMCVPCGGTGEPCCADPSPCVSSRNRCTTRPDGARLCIDCGGENGVCCETTPACNGPLLTCPASTDTIRVCRHCGLLGEECCPSSSALPRNCDLRLACRAVGDAGVFRCAECGMADGQPCCEGNQCYGQRACRPAMGGCVRCGHADEPCCPEALCEVGLQCGPLGFCRS